MKPTCKNIEHLTDYLEGRLSPRHRRMVESHLSDCDQCLEYVHIGRSVTSTFSINKAAVVPTSATKQAIAALDRLEAGSLLDRFASRIRALTLQWQRIIEQKGIIGFAALEPIRGNKTMVADDLVVLNKAFNDLESEIAIEKIDDQRASVSVAITKADVRTPPVRVTLLRDDREVASYLMRSNDAYFESVAFGHYTLMFTRNGARVGQYSFQIKETGNGSQETGR